MKAVSGKALCKTLERQGWELKLRQRKLQKLVNL